MRVALLGDVKRRHTSLILVNNPTLARRQNYCNYVTHSGLPLSFASLRTAHSATHYVFLRDSFRSPLVLTSAGATRHFVSLSHSTPLHSPSLPQSTAIALYLPLRPARSLFISLPSFGFTCFTLFVRFFYGRPFNALARTTAAAAPLRSILRHPAGQVSEDFEQNNREGRERKSPFQSKRVPNLAQDPHKLH